MSWLQKIPQKKPPSALTGRGLYNRLLTCYFASAVKMRYAATTTATARFTTEKNILPEGIAFHREVLCL